MAYNNYNNSGSRGSYNGGSRNNGYNNNYNRGTSQNSVTVPDAKHLDPKSDYVAEAERVMSGIFSGGKVRMTTSKLRNILSMVSDIYNAETRRDEAALLESSKQSLQLMRVRLLYECGRDPDVKSFVEKTQLISYLKGIKDRADFITYAHYLEALVAYHRFFGGRDN